MPIEKSVWGSLFGITRLCRVMPNSDPVGWIFLYAPNSHDRFFFLHTLESPAFDFNVEVAINDSRFYTLMSAISKFDVVCHIAMTSSPNVLTTELRDLLYNQCIVKTCSYSIFSSPEPKAHWWAYSIGKHPLSVVCQLFQTTSPLNPWSGFYPYFTYSICRQWELTIVFFVSIG